MVRLDTSAQIQYKQCCGGRATFCVHYYLSNQPPPPHRSSNSRRTIHLSYCFSVNNLNRSSATNITYSPIDMASQAFFGIASSRNARRSYVESPSGSEISVGHGTVNGTRSPAIPRIASSSRKTGHYAESPVSDIAVGQETVNATRSPANTRKTSRLSLNVNKVMICVC